MPLYLLPVLGVFVGAFVTFIGGGGGAIYIPLLVFLLGLTFKEAVPVSLATMIFTSFFGSISHYRQGHVHLRGGLLSAAGAIIGTGIGTYISTVAPELGLRKAFGILMLATIYPMYIEMRARQQAEPAEEIAREVDLLEHPVRHGARVTAMILLIGVVSGTSAGLFGVSGVVTLIVGFYLIGIAPTVIVGTSIFILLFKAVSGLLWHLAAGPVDWAIVLWLGAGTSIGGFLGPEILARMHSEKAENLLEGVFLVIVALLGIVFLVKGA
jgi:uncharacterized membrane protein YfcA